MTRRAISPRLAMRTLLNIQIGDCRLQIAATPMAERQISQSNLRSAVYFTGKAPGRTAPVCRSRPRLRRSRRCTSALISFITFIASMMQTTVSSVTSWPIVTKGGDSGDGAPIKRADHRRGDLAQIVWFPSAAVAAAAAGSRNGGHRDRCRSGDGCRGGDDGWKSVPFLRVILKPSFSILKTERSFFLIRAMSSLMSFKSKFW